MTPEEWITRELHQLWNDYDDAENRSLPGPGRFSIGMENLLGRIKTATEIVGPIGWENVGGRRLSDGTYQQICEQFGIPYTLPTNQEYDQYVKPRWGKRTTP